MFFAPALQRVEPIPSRRKSPKRAHKLVTLCTVFIARANHHTPFDVGVDAAFSKTSLHNPASLSLLRDALLRCLSRDCDAVFPGCVAGVCTCAAGTREGTTEGEEEAV